jgi:hypothetical protein
MNGIQNSNESICVTERRGNTDVKQCYMLRFYRLKQRRVNKLPGMRMRNLRQFYGVKELQFSSVNIDKNTSMSLLLRVLFTFAYFKCRHAPFHFNVCVVM